MGWPTILDIINANQQGDTTMIYQAPLAGSRWRPRTIGAVIYPVFTIQEADSNWVIWKHNGTLRAVQTTQFMQAYEPVPTVLHGTVVSDEKYVNAVHRRLLLIAVDEFGQLAEGTRVIMTPEGDRQ